MGVYSGWRRLFLFLPVILFFTYMLSVLELQRSSTLHDITHKEKAKKFDHLVLGPAAGEGLPDRLQCQGTKAVNKVQFTSSANKSNRGDHITFITVFAAYNSATDKEVSYGASDLVTVGKMSYNKVERSLAVLNVFFNFIQVTMPRSNIVILTDPSSKLPVRRERVTIHPIQGEYSRDRLMLQRIRSYIAFLESRLEELAKSKAKVVDHYIFTDSDIAVIDDLGQMFDQFTNFDLALTFRNNKGQPLNSGFIAVRGTAEGIARARYFLNDVLKVYSTKYMKASRMLGDQLALAWVVKSQPGFDVRRFGKREPFLDEIGGVSVLFLPCSTYNWTPPEGAGQFHGMPLDVKVVHFKGSRKRLMLESWNFLNSSPSSEISDMLCLVVGSGRTKYDF